jgi:hypothetical protein
MYPIGQAYVICFAWDACTNKHHHQHDGLNSYEGHEPSFQTFDQFHVGVPPGMGVYGNKMLIIK